MFHPQRLSHLRQGTGIEHVLLRQPSPPGGGDAVAHVLQSLQGVGVRIDADWNLHLPGDFTEAPVEVEPVRVGVELDHLSVFRGRLQDFLHVERILLAGQQQAPGGMAEHRGTRMLQRPADALGHLGFRHSEVAMHRYNDEVETVQDLLTVIQSPIRQNVRLNAFQKGNGLQFPVELIDFGLLLPDPFLQVCHQ